MLLKLMDELITSTSCPAPGLNNDRNGKAVGSHQVREISMFGSRSTFNQT